MPATLNDFRPRVGRDDLVFALGLSALALLLGRFNYTDGPTMSPADGGPFVVSVWAIPAFLLITLPLLWRGSAPVRAAGLVLGALAVHQLLFGTMVRCGVAFPTLAIIGFAIGARTVGRDRLVGAGVVLAATVLSGFADALSADVLGVGLPVVGASFGVGLLAASRSRMAVRLRDQTAELQHARDERARLEVATDRADLSGELDVLLHHRLEALAALADAGSAQPGAPEATAMLARIEEESRATLDEMRQLVGALRGSDGALATSPLPTLTSLEALVVRTRGPRSSVQIEGDPRVLPPGVELSAYRVVEHLLTALDDAPGVEVRVRFEADRLELRVQGHPRRRVDLSESLARARARVELHDGELSSSTSGARVETTATLPMFAGA